MFKAIKSSNILFFYSICLGFLVCVATYGVYVLNPTYDAWLLNTGGADTVQHYLGWMFYRSSPWHFPLGLIDNLVYPYQVSSIYTDSIPIFALFFKLLSPILPETFQYFGFWALLCFILTTFFSSLIIFRLTNNIYYSMICAVFFTLMPSIFQRMFAHSAFCYGIYARRKSVHSRNVIRHHMIYFIKQILDCFRKFFCSLVVI